MAKKRSPKGHQKVTKWTLKGHQNATKRPLKGHQKAIERPPKCHQKASERPPKDNLEATKRCYSNFITKSLFRALLGRLSLLVMSEIKRPEESEAHTSHDSSFTFLSHTLHRHSALTFPTLALNKISSY